MNWITVSTTAVLAVVLSGVGTRSAVGPEDPQYLFIDARATRSRLTRVVNLSKVEERLVKAGNEGYGIRSVAASSSSVNVLLERDEHGPRTYRLIAETKESTFLREVNRSASEGFRVVPGGIKAFDESVPFGKQTTWLSIMVKHADERRFTYSAAEGTEKGEEALAKASATGRSLTAVVGRQGMVAADPHLFFEGIDGAAAAPARKVDYRILATARTSMLQKDLNEAAGGGFQVIATGLGYMAVVLAREQDSIDQARETRLIAAIRPNTALKELQSGGAEGFRLVGVSENGTEWVFVLERTVGSTERRGYQILALEEETVDDHLRAAQADGYRVISLLSDFVVLEHP